MFMGMLSKSPPPRTLIDPEGPGVPYLFGQHPWTNPPVPISADNLTTNGDGTVTHDLNGSFVHPSVLDFALLTESGTWGGHRYWMANSEYSMPWGNENTMILASDDGYVWRQPEGAEPGVLWTAEDQLPVIPGINTDPELIYQQETDELVHLWRQDSTPTRLWHSKTADGITWSSPLLVGTGEQLDTISPCVVPDGLGGWWMFTWGSTPRRRHASSLTGPWSSPVATTGATPWHGGVWHDLDQGVLYAVGGPPRGNIYAFVSEDALTWEQRGTVLAPRTGWDELGPYRPTMQPHPNGTHFRLWYSTNGFPGDENRTGYTVVPRSLWD